MSPGPSSLSSPGAPPTPDALRATRGGFLDCTISGLVFYYLTSLVVILAAAFGHELLKPANNPQDTAGDIVGALVNWDGIWYRRIAEQGYSFAPHAQSSAVFFPAYPLLGRVLASTGLRTDLALLIVSHLCLLGALILTALYVQERFPASSDKLRSYVLLSIGLFPTSFFFRMGYSESLFLLVLVLFLYGIQRHWPLLWIAAIAGLATAARPVGVVLYLPFLLLLWHRSPTKRAFAVRLVAHTPIAFWGIALFMLHMLDRFGDPLAFVVAQGSWHTRDLVSWPEKMLDLALLEPLASVFDPASPGYWANHPPDQSPVFNLLAANPFYFLLAAGLLGVGIAKRWLTAYEWLPALGLLLVPYLTRGHEMSMASTGRFVSVILPMHVVIGCLLCRLPAAWSAFLLVLATVMMAAYSALFAAAYFVI